MMITYHVKEGAEMELENLLKHTWKVYRKKQLVLDEPHICLRIVEGGQRVRVVEVLRWAGPFATEHPPESVSLLWEEMQSLCEARDGKPGIEVRRADILKPRGF
jgi:hypothetical protein